MTFFASQHPPQTIDVAGIPGHTVTIRKLSHTALRDAEIAMFHMAIERLRQRGAAAIYEEIEAHGGDQGVRAICDADPVQRYDPDVLVERSVLSWNPERARPTLEQEPELVMWLAREILKLSAPRLFK